MLINNLLSRNKSEIFRDLKNYFNHAKDLIKTSLDVETRSISILADCINITLAYHFPSIVLSGCACFPGTDTVCYE